MEKECVKGESVDSIALESFGFNGIIKSAVSPFSKSRDGTGTGHQKSGPVLSLGKSIISMHNISVPFLSCKALSESIHHEH
jgi:hypothetical protein